MGCWSRPRGGSQDCDSGVPSGQKENCAPIVTEDPTGKQAGCHRLRVYRPRCLESGKWTPTSAKAATSATPLRSSHTPRRSAPPLSRGEPDAGKLPPLERGARQGGGCQGTPTWPDRTLGCGIHSVDQDFKAPVDHLWTLARATRRRCGRRLEFGGCQVNPVGL